MDGARTELIQAARAVCRELPLQRDFSAGTVGAAIRTATGRVYAGVCLDLACGLGFCAKAAAIADMVKHKAGAAREGVLRQRLLLHGAWHDAVMFSFVRPSA